MHRFELIAPHQFLCTVSSKPELVIHDATLTSTDQSIFNALKCSTQAIQVCVSDFTQKRGNGTTRRMGVEVDEEDTVDD